MANKQIYITSFDKKRLKELILVAREFDSKDEKYLKDLEGELDKGIITKSEEIPNDVITMNTKVQLKDLARNEEVSYELVFPDMADMKQNRISILAPIGTALLGYKIGDVIEWKVPEGKARLKVEKIFYQPEAAGDFHL